MPKKESELVSLHKADSSDEEEEFLIRKGNPVVRQLTEDDLLLESSTVDDLLAALNDAKYIAPLVALCVMLVGLFMATDMLHPHPTRTPRMSPDEFVSGACLYRITCVHTQT